MGRGVGGRGGDGEGCGGIGGEWGGLWGVEVVSGRGVGV